MRLIATLISSLMLCACIHKGNNPVDPYESMNRKIYNFNMAFDATVLKPPAKLYKAAIPAPVRKSINNAYNNVYMLPTVASDLFQGEWKLAIKDSWRFLINSTFGIAGFFDVADKSFSLPPHYNDFGLTFAKWGHKKSAYLMLPFLGPSTVRDALGLPLDYAFTPYPYIPSGVAIYSIAILRYIDLRSQLLETDAIMNQALDKYAFMRDAYLQHRNFLITGEQADTDASLYVDEVDVSDYVDEESSSTKKPVNSRSSKNAPHRSAST
ncbi:VacJ family lipoprotein [Legionella maceachernii]|uniref:Lipoprotein VacJ-like protein n=1 Tax=Legionella maceachernii TaxID=466 RepID=A0A0W0VXB5_9GAMM|nr:VacJ family lipoprotein [Legionella maceachernii]KTD24542.1 lipoprotein VacJ-like protein [Legionella maceachernii]SJZ62044.1 phospholipid-binding lipoprotein MlaA [Legionella maceachernii]SUP00947.1 Probable phospholipid-binding lipoprotein mlaA precursor [Legionella maceachernii]